MDTETLSSFLMLMSGNVNTIYPLGSISQTFPKETIFFPFADTELVIRGRLKAKSLPFVVLPVPVIIIAVKGAVVPLPRSHKKVAHLSEIDTRRVCSFGYHNGIMIPDTSDNTSVMVFDNSFSMESLANNKTSRLPITAICFHSDVRAVFGSYSIVCLVSM